MIVLRYEEQSPPSLGTGKTHTHTQTGLKKQLPYIKDTALELGQMMEELLQVRKTGEMHGLVHSTLKVQNEATS